MERTMSDRLIIIDGNSVLYREFYALPITMKNAKGQVTNAIYGFANQLFKILKDLKPTHLAVAFDVSKKTFRTEMFSDYKATRKPMPDELRSQIVPLKEMLQAMNIAIVQKEGFEGDDIVGSLAKSAKCETIIITGDRDTFQLIDDTTKVYLNRKGMTDVKVMDEQAMQDVYGVTPSEFVYVKALAGDTSDNIPGVKGVGEKSAISLVQEYKNLDNIYANLDNIKPALRNKLIENKESAYISYELAKIKTDVDLAVSIEEMKVQLPFSSEVVEIFRDNAFRSLLSKKEFFDFSSGNGVGSLEKIPLDKKSIILESNDDFNNLIQGLLQQNEFGFVIQNGVIHVSDGKDDYAIKQKENLIDNGVDELELFAGLKKVFENEKLVKVLFDSKSDRHYFETNGIEVRGEVFDCMIARHLVKGESVTSLHLVSDDFERVENLPALSLTEAKAILIEDLNQLNMRSLYYDVELPFAKVLFNMEKRGFKIDRVRLKELDVKFSAEIESLSKTIYEMVGREFNINSPKQLSEIIYDELKLATSKKKSTAAEALEAIEDRHPLIPAVIRYRKVAKFQSSFIKNMYDKLDKNDFIHTTFNQTLTTTGRLSSVEPNLQNIPIRGDESREIRSMFVASSEDNVLIDADYSQIELRVLAHLCEDEGLIEAFEKGIDIHTHTAMSIFAVPEVLVTPDMRRLAKVVNFGVNYGISEYGLARDLKIPVYEAKEYIDNYYTAHPKIKKYMQDSIETARETGRVVTLLGRTRKMSEISSSNYMVRQSAERASQNMPMQGGAADIIKLAMLKIEKRLESEGYKARLIMQVHDELIIDSPKSEAEQVREIVVTEMKNAYKMLIPLDVDSTISYRWSEGH